MAKVREVRFDTIVRAEPERVFDAIATADGLDAWFTSGTTLEAKAGGALIFRWVDWGLEKFTGEMAGNVIESNRPGKFVFRWPVDSDGYMTTVTITIEATEEGSIVRLVEGEYEKGEVGNQDMLNRASGWAQALTLMKFRVEHGVTC